MVKSLKRITSTFDCLYFFLLCVFHLMNNRWSKSRSKTIATSTKENNALLRWCFCSMMRKLCRFKNVSSQKVQEHFFRSIFHIALEGILGMKTERLLLKTMKESINGYDFKRILYFNT